MRVERFQEENMQKAMARVRSELGQDAVLISSRNIDGQIEVMAASDYDPEQLKQEMNKLAPKKPAGKPKSEFLFEVLSDKQTRAEQAPSLMEMQEELGRLRELFEGELAQLAWRDARSRQPNRMALLTRLEEIGVSRDIAVKIVNKILPCDDLELGWRRSLRILTKVVKAPAHDPLRDGGVIALVGPTGVGKTTTAAKLAAQFAERHGRNQVALVTTDNVRVGGKDQLISLGSTLGIPVQVASDAQELRRTLDSFAGRKLVIIDTAGVNPRSQDLLAEYEKTVGENNDVLPFLVLSATAQESVISETIRAYSALKLMGAIITKTDENVSIGAAISGAIRFRLPVAFLGIGQSIPEDLIAAEPKFFWNKLLENYRELRRQRITVQPRQAMAGQQQALLS
ncbi:MAG: flagellar biosynthesis protein FlhF [Pseudomonadales bacterium]|nr:flagellar biosynthesis protein FlhF [Pseudomonadales bacterium]